MEESLRKVKTLGQADEEVDDLAKWVTKSRTREEEDKELAREEALNAQRRQAEQVCLSTCWCQYLTRFSPERSPHPSAQHAIHAHTAVDAA